MGAAMARLLRQDAQGGCAFHRAGIQSSRAPTMSRGFAFQRELELYVKAGIPANEVLRIATGTGLPMPECSPIEFHRARQARRLDT